MSELTETQDTGETPPNTAPTAAAATHAAEAAQPPADEGQADLISALLNPSTNISYDGAPNAQKTAPQTTPAPKPAQPAAGAAKGATLADDAFDAAFREFALHQLATDDLSTGEAAKLAAMLQASQRLALDKGKLDAASRIATRRLEQSGKSLVLAERRVALLEKHAAAAREKLSDALKSGATGGVSAETLKQVEEALKLL
jgi:hypothetical protein